MMRLLFLCLTLATSFSFYSQRPTDLELWTSASLELKVSKRLKVQVMEQARFDNAISNYQKSFTEVAAKLKFNDYFSLGGNYRYIQVPAQVGQQRLAVDGNLKFGKKDFPLSFNYRIRFQHVLNDNKTYIRNKVGLDYNMSKLVDPYVAYEIFFRLNGKNEFRVSRFTAGLEWRITKPLHLLTFYRLQDDIFIKKPERQHIIGISAMYELDIRKKKSASKSNE
ncbi:MAG: DUF2490 domain-containing protein [Bacteroidetes bacterium]|nr:MAG: DUF2490 domain-containing protein [Bacteroidota bacterium]